MTTPPPHRLPRGAALALIATSLLAPGCWCTPKTEPSPVDEDPIDDARPDPSDLCVADEAHEPPATLCPAERLVVQILPANECPVPSDEGWRYTRVSNHCIYAYVDAGPTQSLAREDFRGLQHDPLGRGPQFPGQVEVEHDCMLLASAPPDPPTVDRLREFLEVEFGSALAPVAEESSATVTVAVIDTAPTNPTQGRAVHGRLMRAIVQKVAANESIRVLSYPGLPRDREGKADFEEGGYYGFQSDLAFAIDDAVTEWQEMGPHGPLILNLSVGWEPNAALQPGTSLVAAAIGRARCAGALVFAATGNRHPRTCVSGATGPAMFAGWEAPSAEQCQGNLDLHPSAKSPSKPLVHAVSAVERDGQPFALARPQSNAALAALGLDAVVKVGDEYLGPQSGTSVATAIVSGAAARLWATHPERNGDAIANQLWQEGTSFAAVVDPSLASREWTQQHVVALAVSSTSFTKLEFAAHSQPISSEMPVIERMGETCSVCDMQETVRTPAGLTLPTLTQTPWVIPQPDDVLCPLCGIDKGNLYLGMAAAYASHDPIVDVRVTFWSGTSFETLHFGSSLKIPVEPNLLTLSDPELCTVGSTGSSPTNAWIEFVFGGTDVAGSPTYYSRGNQITVRSGLPCPG